MATDLGYIVSVFGIIFGQIIDLMRVPVYGGYSLLTIFVSFLFVELLIDFVLGTIEYKSVERFHPRNKT